MRIAIAGEIPFVDEVERLAGGRRTTCAFSWWKIFGGDRGGSGG